MVFRSVREIRLAKLISRLTYCNPFLPERIALERELLGSNFVPSGAVWNLRTSLDGDRPNLAPLTALVNERADVLASRLQRGEPVTDVELPLVVGVALHHLYYKYRDRLMSLPPAAAASGPVNFFSEFSADVERFRPPGGAPFLGDAAHVLACCSQILRAFINIYNHLVGGSAPMARLRAQVWQSIFTENADRYFRGLYRRMPDVATLVLGATGTGKELVARAIAHSGYVRFDAKARRFVDEPGTTFLAVNLAALSSSLIEAELFGHHRGSFTGAMADRKGFLEECSGGGVIFLDEIGDLDAALQVKLLRVLQDRTFQRIGETKPRRFLGKIVAATNRDLTLAMSTQRFRADFYYRLCGDLIATPTLTEQLADNPDDLPNLVRFITEGVATPELAPDLAAQVMQFIRNNLLPTYHWPGNFRELEQCVRNVMVRGRYQPQPSRPQSPIDDFAAGVCNAAFSADELLGRYFAVAFNSAGTLRETARRLGTDARTVKARLDRAFLLSLRPAE